jgi:spermidine synthase
MLDAYYTDSIPFHLTTQEFFRIADRKLSSDGVFVVNIIGAVTGPSGKITRSIARTLRQVFPQIYIFPTRRTQNVSLDTTQNVIIVATKERARADIRAITQKAASLNRDIFPSPIQDIAVSYIDKPVPDDDVPVLTDDYAPTDNLLHP